MRHILLYLLLLLFPLMFVSAVPMQGGGVSGVVSGEDGQPLGGVHVAIPLLQRGVVSDEQGRFFIAGIPAGTHLLRITHLGYRAREIEVQCSEGGSTLLEPIRLTAVPIDLGEVHVFSTRSDDLIKNVPYPISVATSEQLVRTPAISIPDALDTHTGVTLVRDGSWGTDVSIRGLSRSNVVTLVDGARIETATNHAAGLSLIDISDVDRVEVIRGAASTLYGSGATGGVVNIVTASGGFSEKFRMGGALAGGITSANNGGSGSMTLDASGAEWYGRVHGRLRSAEDTRTPQGPLKDSRFHDRSVSVSAGLRPLEGHELTARYQLVRATDVGIPGGASFPANASARYPTEERELLTAAYTIPDVLPNMQRTTLRYMRQIIERDVELTINPTTTLRPSAEHTMDGVQLNTNWTPGATHRLAAGIDAWQRQYTGRRIRELRARNTVIADLPLPDATFRSIGVYAQDDMSLFAEKLNATVGARADLIDVWNDKAYDLLYTVVNGVRNDAPPARVVRWEAAESQELSWSANAGVRYTLREGLDATINASESFRAPALEERYQYIELGGATYIGDPDLSAEKGTCLDFGLHLRSDRAVVTTNAFVNWMRDLVVDQQLLDTLYVKRNVGEARLYGFELGMEYNPFAMFVLFGNLSYVRGENTGSATDLPAIPPMMLRSGIRFPLFDMVHAELRSTITADQEHVAAGEKTTPGTVLIDLQLRSTTLRFAGMGVQIFAGVENIFDRSWRRHLSTLRGLIALEPGRNAYARLRVLW